MNMTRLFTVLMLIATLLTPVSRAFGQDPGSDHQWEFTTKGKVVVIGSTFSDYDDFVRLLASHNLIDHNNNWIAEDAHLVQTGNILPRTSDWKKLNALKFEHEKIARLLMSMDKQAKAQGGRVHSLMGQIEVQTLRWRIELVPRNVQELFAGPDADAKRQVLLDRWIIDRDAKFTKYPEATREQLKTNHNNYMNAIFAPGCVEYLERFGKYDAQTHGYDLDTDFARWIRGRNTIVKINDVLYTPSGISPVMAGIEPREETGELRVHSIGEMNDSVRARNDDPTLFYPVDADKEGPIAWSGLLGEGEFHTAPYMRRIQEVYNVKGMVVGRSSDRRSSQIDNLVFLESGLGSRDIAAKINSLTIEGDHWTIIEERRPIESGDFTLIGAEVLQGGPDNPIKPGGGPPVVKDPGNTGGR